jgi:sigma-B regulation protein RsbU (phosphoserine phosphatase)
LLVRTLEQWGYEVVAARDGAEAWQLFEERDFPLVISDWVMPGLDGVELVRRIRATARSGYVFTILLTARSLKEDVVAGMAAGADDFVTKPFDRDELRARLRAGERVLRLEATLLEQNRLLTERNAQMEADLRMACEVQQALLPQGYPNFPGHVPPEASALRFCDRYRPNGAVGGDFFDVLALSDTQAGLFICDVMGHGVRAALVTAMVRVLLESCRPLATEPGRFLAEINREILTILGPTSVTVFLSAFYLTLDTRSGQMVYANAGHPVPFWVRRQAGEVVPLPQVEHMPGPPLGVRDQAVFSVTEVHPEVGDVMVLFTDGLFEVTGPAQEPFGEERLRRALEKRRHLPVGRMFDEVLGEVMQFTAGRGFADDLCLLGMEVLELGAPVGETEAEEASWRG